MGFLSINWLVVATLAQAPAPQSAPAPLAPLSERYTKLERMVPMRDGVALFTAIYLPKTSEALQPVVLQRTPYSCAPYGEDKFPDSIGPSAAFHQREYIVVRQDVRGCWRSEGVFENMRPQLVRHGGDPAPAPAAGGASAIDESTDTWDTIDWLIKNVPGHNGRVGMWGISYPGFYAAVGMIGAHPALKCSSPQAPIADWYFDDFRHHGALFLPHAFHFLNGFGVERPGPTSERRKSAFEFPTPDGYQFFLELGPLKNADARCFQGKVAYWNELLAHPNYDEFWQARNLLPHLRNVAPAVLTVGGWFDAEDLYGPLQIYRAIERLNPGVENALVMGPWSHGGWARGDGDRLGDIRFGGKQSAWYREQVELPFFERHLRADPPAPAAGTDATVAAAAAATAAAVAPPPPEATVFETGANRWRTFAQWPPKEATPTTWYVRGDSMLARDAPPTDAEACDEFLSDPRKPVPANGTIARGMTSEYMIEDQRFAASRPDVLWWRTAPLEQELTLVGPLLAQLYVSTTREDADWVVKVIDVFPDDFAWPPEPDAAAAEGGAAAAGAAAAAPARRAARETPMGGYQMLVRSEVIRGRFRDSYAEPKPFRPGEPTLVRLPLQDVLHTFRKGHRLMIQVQSTWFPLVDRNPQTWVADLSQADVKDFQPASHRIWRDATRPTRIEVAVLPAAAPAAAGAPSENRSAETRPTEKNER